MLASEKVVMTRELKNIFFSVAGLLYYAGYSNIELCAMVKQATRESFGEMEGYAQTTKDKGGN